MTWFKLEDSFFWTMTTNGFRVGNQNYLSDGTITSYEMQPKKAIFDISTTMIHLPQFVGEQIIGLVLRKVNYFDLGGYFAVPCDTTFYDSVFFMV